MPIMISIPDDCKFLAEAVQQLVTSVDRAQRRAAGGRAVDYAQIERDIRERTAAIGAPSSPPAGMTAVGTVAVQFAACALVVLFAGAKLSR